jgi:hypothetical protein
MWNFTQNFLFGLPNSGLVSEVSVLHLDAANGVSNLIYNYEFGVESTVIALIVHIALGAAALLLARRDGRLGELLLSYEKKAELNDESRASCEEPEQTEPEQTETAQTEPEQTEAE